MKIKICGLTRGQDVERAVANGATHVGFVRCAASPRCVTLREAAELCAGLPARVSAVLVYRAMRPEDVLREVEESGIRRVQLHGCAETVALSLERRGCLVHRVLEVDPHGTGAIRPAPVPTSSRPWHLDVGGGGSGRRFDWNRLAPRAPRFTFVAGGITPENVADLVRREPFGIDVSSGVESAPGVKDPGRLDALFGALGGAS